jgi:hypothetical protein
MALRQQSAIEFISTYSFAIFMISIILVAATTISLSIGFTAPVYSSCSIQPLITCQQSLLTFNSVGNYFTYIILFRNNLGFVLQFPANALNLTATGISGSARAVYNGICAPTLAAQGSQVLCKVKVGGPSNIKQGANTYTQFHIYYGLCTNQTESTCTSNNLNITGYSYQTLSPPLTNLYNISVSSQNGLVVVNGQSYFNSSTVYLPSGSYNLFAQPSTNYHFVSWTWNGPGATTLSTNSVANTVLTLNSNGNVIVLFTHN